MFTPCKLYIPLVYSIYLWRGLRAPIVLYISPTCWIHPQHTISLSSVLYILSWPTHYHNDQSFTVYLVNYFQDHKSPSSWCPHEVTCSLCMFGAYWNPIIFIVPHWTQDALYRLSNLYIPPECHSTQWTPILLYVPLSCTINPPNTLCTPTWLYIPL